jgi:maleate cis-trans isomerase
VSVGTKGAIRLGMLTPSSNTVLETATVAMIADLSNVSAHFSRFRVTQIGLQTASLINSPIPESCTPRSFSPTQMSM